MANIGSAFLGDRQRLRHLSSSTTHSASTPPSSPPPTGASGIMYGGASSTSPLSRSFNNDDLDDTPTAAAGPPIANVFVQPLPAVPPKPIDPKLALELRVRWLEAIVYGGNKDAVESSQRNRKGPLPPSKTKQREIVALRDGETLVRKAGAAQQKLDTAVEENEGLKKFMSHYDQHAQYLTPTFALSGVSDEYPSESYSNMTPEEIDAFLNEMEPDIRAGDRDMREIETLVKKGVTSARKLPEHAKLQPRLDELIAANRADLELAASLEKRIATLMQRHATSVDALSELFVAWDDALTSAEDSIITLEKNKRERRRLGLE